MKEKAENDLRMLYENYGRLLCDKEQIEIEIRVRQGILNLLAQEEARQKAEEEAKADE